MPTGSTHQEAASQRKQAINWGVKSPQQIEKLNKREQIIWQYLVAIMHWEIAKIQYQSPINTYFIMWWSYLICCHLSVQTIKSRQKCKDESKVGVVMALIYRCVANDLKVYCVNNNSLTFDYFSNWFIVWATVDAKCQKYCCQFLRRENFAALFSLFLYEYTYVLQNDHYFGTIQSRMECSTSGWNVLI